MAIELDGLTGISASGNIQGANITASGNVTATGNVAATYFVGNGAALTGIVASAGASITNGTSNVSISGSGANVTVSVAGVGNVAVFSSNNLTISGNLLPAGNVLKNIGSATNAFNDLFLANGTIYLGNASISANATSIIMTNESGQQTVLTGSGTVTPYGNSNVSAYLAGGTNSANIITTANISGNYILGNGSFLTGVASSYGNAEVSNYLASGTDTANIITTCLLYTSPSPRDRQKSRMPSSA